MNTKKIRECAQMVGVFGFVAGVVGVDVCTLLSCYTAAVYCLLLGMFAGFSALAIIE